MIAKEATANYLRKELESFVWMKKLTRDQLEDEFKDWKVKPIFKTEPWTHQLVCFYLGMSYPQFMFLLDMGLGKTKILLDIMTQRQREGKFKRALITVPRLINLGSWQEAVAEHSDLGSILVTGGTQEEKWDALMNPNGQVTVVDYAGLQFALGRKVKNGKGPGKMFPDEAKIKMLAKQFDFFGMDESHKAKNRETVRYRILNALTQRMPARYATTGTLFGRNPEDLFTQFHLIDRGETFGNTLGLFRSAFFIEKEHRWKGIEHIFNKGMTHALYRRIQHRSIRYDETECLDLPERREIRVTVPFSDEAREHYLRALEGLIQAKGKLRELDSNFLRMRQIVAGFLQWRDDDRERHEVLFRNNPKLDKLEQLITESGDSKVVVSHEYTRSGELITERLDAMKIKYEWLHGGSKDPINAVNRFTSDPDCKVFLMNSESGGTGVDGLQKVARYLIFYESPLSVITRKQVIKRVHRPGQERRSFIYDIVTHKSIDLRILADQAEGRNLHASLIDGSFDARQLRLVE